MLYIEFRCHIIRVMLTGVRGNAAVEQGRAVFCCNNGCMCLVWGGIGVYVAGEWVHVLKEKRCTKIH